MRDWQNQLATATGAESFTGRTDVFQHLRSAHISHVVHTHTRTRTRHSRAGVFVLHPLGFRHAAAVHVPRRMSSKAALLHDLEKKRQARPYQVVACLPHSDVQAKVVEALG